MDDNTKGNQYPNDDDKIEEGESLIHPLPEDNDTPFSPPTDPIEDPAAQLDTRTQEGHLDPSHQDTDNATDIDTHQVYDEGLAAAAESSEPNEGNAVVDYDPEKDQRNDKTDNVA